MAWRGVRVRVCTWGVCARACVRVRVRVRALTACARVKRGGGQGQGARGGFLASCQSTTSMTCRIERSAFQ